MRRCLTVVMTNIAVCAVHHIDDDVALTDQALGVGHELNTDVNLTCPTPAIGERRSCPTYDDHFENRLSG